VIDETGSKGPAHHGTPDQQLRVASSQNDAQPTRYQLVRQSSDEHVAALSEIANAILPAEPNETRTNTESTASTWRLNRHAQRTARRRDRVFGTGPRVPLDRNQKAKLSAFVEWLTKQRDRVTGRWSLSRAAQAVAKALLWQFHNRKTGRCDPAYEAIAEAAAVARSTVYEALRDLEAAGVLTWTNRRVWRRVPVGDDLLGTGRTEKRTQLTSNAYAFTPREKPTPPSKSDPRTRTTIQEPNLLESSGKTEIKGDLAESLGRLFEGIVARQEARRAKPT
jgi:hypothetical protein